MTTRNINTSLVAKNEAFKLLALAESLGVPVLLIGVPGTGKTQIVLDYTSSMISQGKDGDASIDNDAKRSYVKEDVVNQIKGINAEVATGNVFILETDEGTRPSAVKGHVNFAKLAVDNQYEMLTPIADAKTILINEIDKASPGLRNALLGVMNEKTIFNGSEIRPCKWDMFIATCNKIPEDEIDSPMWDRFMIKLTIDRISPSQLVSWSEKGGRNFRQQIDVKIPDLSEIEAVDLPKHKFEKFVEVAYEQLSDRTLTFVPVMVKATSIIWNCSIDKAMIRVADLLCGTSVSKKLSKLLLTPEMKEIINSLQMLQLVENPTEAENRKTAIEEKIRKYLEDGRIDESQVIELSSMIEEIMEENPFSGDYQTEEGDDQVMSS